VIAETDLCVELPRRAIVIRSLFEPFNRNDAALGTTRRPLTRDRSVMSSAITRVLGKTPSALVRDLIERPTGFAHATLVVPAQDAGAGMSRRSTRAASRHTYRTPKSRPLRLVLS
jgi:hypothetical protein